MRISLNGDDWLFKDFYGEDWRWRDVFKPGTRDVRWWRSGGCVPGSVLDDLWRLGEIADPYVGQNSLLCEWVPQRTWVYKKAFDVPEAARDAAQARLVFEGVDYEAEFFLNGEPLGTHRSVFTRAEFEVGDRLRYGAENLLAVALAAAPMEQPQVGRTSRVRALKPRMNYWWDFCPRLIHQGIWDDVFLDFTGPARIADVFVRPMLNDDFTQADVTVEVTLASIPGVESEVKVALTLRYEGQTVAEAQARGEVHAGSARVSAALSIDRPRLWWPNGEGEQALYDCEVTLRLPASDGGFLPSGERASVRFGIRRIELAPNDTPDASARPYTFVVNGRKVYINGWNWVPIDALYGVPRPEKLERLLTLARDAHVNLLRVWGGGLIETEAFYRLCDEMGLMVWQEFTQSSSGIDNAPSTDPDYIATLTGEAERIVPRRRNHPSLAVWCGGNELQGRPGMASAPDVARDAEQPLDDDHPTLAALKTVVERLDSGRPWLPTSPTGRAFGNSIENIAADPLGQHDVHGPWEYQGVTKHYTLYNAGTSLFHSEFGVEGMTNAKTLDRVVPPPRQWPVDLALNRDLFHLGAWWVRRVVWDETFGPLSDVATYIRATQFTQADGLRYAIEADRRRRWRNSGVIPWQLNEPYPMAACTSAVDYWAEPKPVYYAVARAYAPLTVTAAFPTVCWDGRDSFEATVSATDGRVTGETAGVLTARLVGASGRVFREMTREVSWAAGGATELTALRHPMAEIGEDVFCLDLHLATEVTEGAEVLEEQSLRPLRQNRYLFTRGANLAGLMAPQSPTTLTAANDASGEEWRVTLRNAGDYAALWVWLEDGRERGGAGWAYFDDNYFCLLPGEERAVRAMWRGVPAQERRLDIAGWNTNRVTLSTEGAE